MTAFSSTVDTPAGPFTAVVGGDGAVLASGWTASLDELLPDAERIVYLDVDLLVRGSLLPLWRTPLQGNLIAAVTNVPPGTERAYTERPELETLGDAAAGGDETV